MQAFLCCLDIVSVTWLGVLSVGRAIKYSGSEGAHTRRARLEFQLGLFALHIESAMNSRHLHPIRGDWIAKAGRRLRV